MITIVGLVFSVIYAYTNSFKNDAEYVQEAASLLFHIDADDEEEVLISKDPVNILEDPIYKSRVFTELDKRDHTMMLYNIPQDIPAAEVKIQIKQLFTAILQDKNVLATDELLGIQVHSDYSLCEELSEKRKHYEGKLSSVKEENFKLLALNQPKVVMKLLNNNEVDAQQFWEKKILDNVQKLAKETND